MDIVDSILDIYKLQSKYVIWWVDAVHHTDRHMMCDVHFKLHTLHCKLQTLHFKLHTSHCKLH